ncbi:helix-turn-helix domain-containing protein [Photobacterium damselae subsp. damselae]|uniref:helix-turn-helix domain-containing protein n=1 Tax=Photobacterium damselae TaxID=38293 RepID=UPI001F43F12A|nr:helix-turn-helix transcriptional regulator [Photobacterium damselae]UKA08845.1 helix-turn-helix domain-containing protein [Photobacterium damselae subsp. damselae]UKA23952.1 helix-turn-helix domain-containing protein [Photobacterium damselae subsp. damselae]
MSFNKRLKAVIREERYSQREFAEAVGIPLRTLEDYLSGRTEPGLQAIAKIVSHPKFKKYNTWLIYCEIDESSGQICPDFSTQEQCGLLKKESEKRA